MSNASQTDGGDSKSPDPHQIAAEVALDAGLNEPIRKGGLPRWVWYSCGCGCLMLFLVVALLGGGTYWIVKDSTNPEIQWAHLREQLYFEEQPRDLLLEFGVQVPRIEFLGKRMPGSEEYALKDPEDGYSASVKLIADPDQVRELLAPGGYAAAVEMTGAEAVRMELQGREVEALRFENTETSMPFMNEDMKEKLDQGAGIRFALPRGTKPDPERFLVIELRSGVPAQHVTPEQIADFFDHFELWR